MNKRFHEDFPVTALLLLLLVGFYVLEVLAQQRLADPGRNPGIWTITDLGALRLLGALNQELVLRDLEVWRLISCEFLHGGVLHLLCNGVVLLDLGRFCETRLSSWKFFTVYMASAVGASIGSCLWQLHGAQRHPELGRLATSVGASGALSGLIGLMLVYAIRRGHRGMRDALVRWVLLIVLISLLMPRIDHAAHIGGFITGALLGWGVRDYVSSAEARRWQWPAWGAGAILGASLLLAVLEYFQAVWPS